MFDRALNSLGRQVVLAVFVSFVVFLGGGMLVFVPSDAADHEDEVQWGPDLDVTEHTANSSDSPNLTTVVQFLDDGRYLGWQHDPRIRPTGDVHRTTKGEIVDGTTHHRVRIYYSPSVVDWLKNGRKGEMPDRSMIVKEMYQTIAPVYPVKDEVIGWAAMVKKAGAAHDGWFWVIYFKPAFRSMDTMGTFGYSYCQTCHASTVSENTFADLDNLTGANGADSTGRSFLGIVDPLFFQNVLNAPVASDPLPRDAFDPDMEALFSDAAIYPYTSVPAYQAEAIGKRFPSSDFDHVWNPADLAADEPSYVTSDNCIGCHDATFLVDTKVPNMLIRRPVYDHRRVATGNELLNLSVYGEWRSSPMGMAGRDPVFFAQLESELNMHPDQADLIQNTCLSCHGVMGQHQFQVDKGKDQNFLISDVFATTGASARYGALARDGISCAVCHQMAQETFPDVSGKALPDTGEFIQGAWSAISGPTTPDDDVGGAIRPLAMQNALGVTPSYDPHIKTSELCGVCHTITLPVFTGDEKFKGTKPVGDDDELLLSEAHEQDTYLEWLFSAYQNSNPAFPTNPATARTCADCHMSSVLDDADGPISTAVANIEDANWPTPPALNLAPADAITLPVRDNFKRHTFFGMNLFVLSMYRQFTETIFGVEPDSNPPNGTLNPYDLAIETGERQIRNKTANVEVLDVGQNAGELTARVSVTNQAGHRLPSGVGFRRAWLEFAVLDAAGKVLWGSGLTNPQGVIVGPDDKPLASEFTSNWHEVQPHWDEITDPSQVQIYEERTINQYRDETAPTDSDPQIRLTTSFLGIGKVVKDNRLLPRGYYYDYILKSLAAAPEPSPAREKFDSLLPTSLLPDKPGAVDPRKDPRYSDGSGVDEVTYRIPLTAIQGAASVRVRLNYQNLPPYYLRDRFAYGRGPETQRLYYLVGHLQTAGTAIEDWKIQIAEGNAPIPGQLR